MLVNANQPYDILSGGLSGTTVEGTGVHTGTHCAPVLLRQYTAVQYKSKFLYSSTATCLYCTSYGTSTGGVSMVYA